jgi:uncharacterized membrane protein
MTLRGSGGTANGGSTGRWQVRNLLALFRGQLWSVPAVFTVVAATLAYLLLNHGTLLTPVDAEERWWLYSGEAETARELLSSLLSGMMTMTSLVVSVTFVILTLAANQLGPRLIEIFMGDRQIQSVLGLFIGTILYQILILRSLDQSLGEDGVPHLAVTGASLLTVICLLALLFYIHKIARSIIADNVVEAVASELRRTLKSVMSSEDGNGDDSAPSGPPVATIAVERQGYIQIIDYEELARIACVADLVFEVRVRAGHHILREGQHVLVHGAGPPDEDLVDKVRKTFTVGALRTPAQDPEHGIRQLVEIATRALSPGTNDPYTAKAVIDRLSSTFEEIFSHGVQPHLLTDEKGVLRVVADRADIEGLLDTALHPLRQAGSDHPAILIHIADAVGALAFAIRTSDQRDALRNQLGRLEQTADLGRMTEQDRRDTMRRIVLARKAVENSL